MSTDMSPCCQNSRPSIRYQVPCYTNDDNELVLCFGEAVKEAKSVFSCSESMFKKFQEHVKGRSTARLTLKSRYTTRLPTYRASPLCRIEAQTADIMKNLEPVQEKNKKFSFIFKTEESFE
jgi:hypothetical protein